MTIQERVDEWKEAFGDRLQELVNQATEATPEEVDHLALRALRTTDWHLEEIEG